MECHTETKEINPARENKTKVEVSIWSGFYKKALKERQNLLRLVFPHIFVSAATTPENKCFPQKSILNGNQTINGDDNNKAGLPFIIPRATHGYNIFPINGLESNLADNMIENCIGTMGLPVGLALNFIIDGSPVVIPMAIEEPSVVAAVSGAAKTICASTNDGFITNSPERNVIIAQLLLPDIPNSKVEEKISTINDHRDSIIDYANQFCRSMKARGGGVVDIYVRKLPVVNAPDTTKEFLGRNTGHKYVDSARLVVHVIIDVCDAMGANCASSVAEGLSPFIADLTNARVAVKIVSNLNPQRVTTASFCINVKYLAYKNFTGDEVAARILEAYFWACDDPFRATTHNKGIMNGIDAVALATGQDWRAVEASCHAWASGASTDEFKYGSLTRYWIEKRESTDKVTNEPTTSWFLCGSLSLPLIVGTKGGVISTSPLYSYTLGIMGFPDSKRLAAAMCCVGLCQNFAAMRALTTEGIQRGHMHLHARNIAFAAGAPTTVIPEVTLWMIEKAQINIASAREYITAHRLYTKIRNSLISHKQVEQKSPSMFYFIDPRDSSHTLNIGFQTIGPEPVFLDFTDAEPKNPIHAALLGGKTYDWMTETFRILDYMRLPLINSEDLRTNERLCYRLKVLSLILNILLRRLMIWCPKETRRLAEWIFVNTLRQRTPSSSPVSSPKQTLNQNFSTFEKIEQCPSGFQPGNCSRPSMSRYLLKILKRASAMRNDKSSNFNNNGNSQDCMFISSSSSQLFCSTSPLPDPSIPSSSPSSVSSSSAIPSTSSNLDEAEWELPQSGIFKSEVFDTAFFKEPSEPVISENENCFDINLGMENPNRRILELGFPLFVAVWQVFEVWVTQYVSTNALAAAILKEQRIVVSSIISCESDMSQISILDMTEKNQKEEEFLQKFDILSKRPQCTLFLLIDSISLSPDTIQPPFLSCIAQLGLHLEQVASAAHDSSRIDRDYEAVYGQTDPTPNLISISKTLSNEFKIVRDRVRQKNSNRHLVLHVDGIRNSLLTFLELQVGKENCGNLTSSDIECFKIKYREAIRLQYSRELCIRKIHEVCAEHNRSDIAKCISGTFISEVTDRIQEEFLK